MDLQSGLTRRGEERREQRLSFVNVEEEVFQSEAAVEQSSEKLVAGLVPHTLTSIIQLIL